MSIKNVPIFLGNPFQERRKQEELEKKKKEEEAIRLKEEAIRNKLEVSTMTSSVPGPPQLSRDPGNEDSVTQILLIFH
jgi:hypothetical protein